MIPYGQHQIDESDIAAVTEVLRGDPLTGGPMVARFERTMAERCGVRHAVACSSATAALHLAVKAAEIGPGDRVIAPALTFLATANCAVYAQAQPVFSDVDYTTGLMTAEHLTSLLDEQTRAVIPVHFAGLACHMPSLAALVRRRCPQAVLIEDACHALGGEHADGTPVGSCKWSDMTVFSFHPVKHVAAGEGGMVLTDNDHLAARLRLLRNHGMTKDPQVLTRPQEGSWYYEMHEVGFNYRISDINCALAVSQLNRLDAFVARRREIAARYEAAFADLPHTSQPVRRLRDQSAWHIYCLHIDFAALGKTRERVVGELNRQGVGTQVHYYPVPLQPYYRERLGCRPGDFPGAERHYDEVLTIPLFAGMTDAQVSQVVDAVRRVVDGPAQRAA